MHIDRIHSWFAFSWSIAIVNSQTIIPVGCCNVCNTPAPLLLVGEDYLCRTCVRRKSDELLKILERYVPKDVEAYCKDYQCEYRLDHLRDVVRAVDVPAVYTLRISSIGNMHIVVTLKLRMRNMARLLRAKTTIMNKVADSGMFATPACMALVEIETED